MRKLLVATAIAITALSGAAMAETMATAGTDLNMRTGPGVRHDVAGVIKEGDEVAVTGCIESANWCEVVYSDANGWAYGGYLAAKTGEGFQPLYPNRGEIDVAVIKAPAPDAPAGGEGETSALDMGTGAAMGAVIGGATGGLTGAAAEPTTEVQTYILDNPHKPVLLEDEVVLGAGVPETVALYDVPDFPECRYVTINGQTVLLDPQDRRILYIYR